MSQGWAEEKGGMIASQKTFSWLLSTDKVGTSAASVCGLLRAAWNRMGGARNAIAGRDGTCYCISFSVALFFTTATSNVDAHRVSGNTIWKCRTPERGSLSFSSPDHITSRRWRTLRGGNLCRRSTRNRLCEPFR